MDNVRQHIEDQFYLVVSLIKLVAMSGFDEERIIRVWQVAQELQLDEEMEFTKTDQEILCRYMGDYK